MFKRVVTFLSVIALGASFALAAPADKTKPATKGKKDKSLTLKQKINLAKKLRSSFAVLELTLQYDEKGEQPPRGNNTIDEERPYEICAYILSPTEIVVSDPQIPARFIKSTNVRFGDQLVKATPTAYAVDQKAVFLKLAEPLADAKPLKFLKRSKKPYIMVHFLRRDTKWSIRLGGLASAIMLSPDGRAFHPRSYSGSVSGLIVNKKGKAVGLNLAYTLPADKTWKGSPLDWTKIDAETYDAEKDTVKKLFGTTVVRVALSFRSPQKNTSRSRYSGDEEDDTEQNAIGIIYSDNRILVLKLLKPKVTARLQRIVIHYADEKSTPAKFLCNLKDYGAFIATLDTPADKTTPISDTPIFDLRGKLLLSVDAKLQGEKVIAYVNRSRINSYDIGWKRKTFPKINGSDNRMVFTQDGKLVAMPMARRKKVESGNDRWSGSDLSLTPLGHLEKILNATDLAEFSDTSNIPLTEEEENRLAWIGLALQPLDRELARINNVAEVTQNGSFGALISYIYPDSPAAKAGIEVGDILVRIHSKEYPKPVDVKAGGDRFGGRPFPWKQYDQIPEQYYDQIPTPFSPTENFFTRKITDLGFGKEFKLEIYRDGKRLDKDFTVTQSPAYYLSAPKYKSKELGITVRDLTYEARRYFQKKPADPGVIVSKIEPGSKASVAGIKPYELIISVNGVEVKNAKDVEKLLADPGDLKLFVKRMHKGRVIKIRRKAPTTKPATTKPAAEKSADVDEPVESEEATTAPAEPAAEKPEAPKAPADSKVTDE
ncbi:MAG: PDZ domain-containing protein [Phycisphaerae bacterium]|nr:PDZ domain-containing protein [Phycisphaerae bacterium]